MNCKDARKEFLSPPRRGPRLDGACPAGSPSRRVSRVLVGARETPEKVSSSPGHLACSACPGQPRPARSCLSRQDDQPGSPAGILSRALQGFPRSGYGRTDGGIGDVRLPAKERARDGVGSRRTRGVARSSGITSAGLPPEAALASQSEAPTISPTPGTTVPAVARTEIARARPRQGAIPGLRAAAVDPVRPTAGAKPRPGGTECPMGDGPHEGRADRAGDGGREAGPRLTSEVSMCFRTFRQFTSQRLRIRAGRGELGRSVSPGAGKTRAPGGNSSR